MITPPQNRKTRKRTPPKQNKKKLTIGESSDNNKLPAFGAAAGRPRDSRGARSRRTQSRTARRSGTGGLPLLSRISRTRGLPTTFGSKPFKDTIPDADSCSPRGAGGARVVIANQPRRFVLHRFTRTLFRRDAKSGTSRDARGSSGEVPAIAGGVVASCDWLAEAAFGAIPRVHRCYGSTDQVRIRLLIRFSGMQQ